MRDVDRKLRQKKESKWANGTREKLKKE